MRPSDSPEQAAPAEAVQGQEVTHSALENLFDVSPDAIFVTDSEGIIRGANPRAAELFGYTQVELFGQPVETGSSVAAERPTRSSSRHASVI
jgi:PAS domain S-box-containing protein